MFIVLRRVKLGISVDKHWKDGNIVLKKKEIVKLYFLFNNEKKTFAYDQPAHQKLQVKPQTVARMEIKPSFEGSTECSREENS